MEFPIDKEMVSRDLISGPRLRSRARGRDIRKYIIDNMEAHPGDMTGVIAQHFAISRQAANKHLRVLVAEGVLTPEGKTRHRSYKLATLAEWFETYEITPALEEDQVWAKDIAPRLGDLPENVMDMWGFCVTEMINNAVDHSGGKLLSVRMARTAKSTEISIADDGIGIFKKIQIALNLLDERHAILELSKGKLTTDPAKHTGHGIFFTSRMVDSFDILSGGVYFGHAFDNEEDWIIERHKSDAGTTIFLKLNNDSERTVRMISEKYSTGGEDLAFTKTVVPVRLAQYGHEKLISRSQAKRLMVRVDRFKMVLLDFTGVEAIGQAFADEIFRIFARSHPEVQIVPINANTDVAAAIQAVRNAEASEIGGI
jgi:anti-sigma regulatory factor (Ser/Thr protein kinase)